MPTHASRAVYSCRIAYWWNASGLLLLSVGWLVSLTMQVRDGDLTALLFGAVWFAIVSFVARGLLLSSLYRLEADENMIYWLRRGVEHSAPLADISSISSSANLAKIQFRDDHKTLRVFIGGGFEEFTDYVKGHASGVTINLGWASRLTRSSFLLGGGFTAPGTKR